MIHMAPTRLDVNGFWHEVPWAFERATGTDLTSDGTRSRSWPTLRRLAAAGVRHVALRSAGFNHVDLDVARELGVTVVRVPAYSPNAVAEHTRFSRQEVLDLWNDMIACIRNPRGYAVWQVPVVRARKP